MKNARKLALKLVYPGVVVVLIASSAVGPTVAAAQTASQAELDRTAVLATAEHCSRSRRNKVDGPPRWAGSRNFGM